MGVFVLPLVHICLFVELDVKAVEEQGIGVNRGVRIRLAGMRGRPTRSWRTAALSD
jgi:hypothetical protein